MWGGRYVVLDQYLSEIEDENILLGLSTYLTYEDFQMNDENLESRDYLDKVKFIDENNKLWKQIDVWDEAEEYFDYENTKIVEYSGYLINHTKKLFIDLTDYFNQSKFVCKSGEEAAIDLIPVLTETGGGAQMAFFDGIFTDTTEQLAGEWCGDLLQILEEPPKDYKLINCCFAEIWSKAHYCYEKFGVNKDGLLLKDDKNYFEATRLSISGERGKTSLIKVELKGKKISYIPVEIDKEIEEKEYYEQIVLNSFRAGLPLETIAIITDLTTDKITQILKDQDKLIKNSDNLNFKF
jgi:hypothetical protein